MTYQKIITSLMIVLGILGGVGLGALAVFSKLAAAGSAISISYISLTGFGLLGILVTIVGALVIGFMVHVGLLRAPSAFKYFKENFGDAWRDRERTTVLHKVITIKEWIVPRWKGILIFVAIIAGLVLSSYMLGYVGWLIAC